MRLDEGPTARGYEGDGPCRFGLSAADANGVLHIGVSRLTVVFIPSRARARPKRQGHRERSMYANGTKLADRGSPAGSAIGAIGKSAQCTSR